MTAARLILEDGTVFHGNAFSEGNECIGELVFNTAMSGYQEVLTDPSYHSQIVLLTYPLIGNYGITLEDNQSKGIHLEGIIVREYIDFPSNFASTQSLRSFLNAHSVLGVEDIDTRRVTQHIRTFGAQKSLLTTSTEPLEVLTKRLSESPSIQIGRAHV